MGNRTRGMLGFALFALVTASSHAQSSGPPTVLYHLQPGSTYEEGCYGECLCPIIQAPMDGTFGLTLLPFFGPLDTYGVDEVDFSVPALQKVLTGAGFYTLAGELNELGLDISTNGGATMQFTSGGLVPAGAEFPEIDIVISVNQMESCFDYVLHIVATPLVYPTPELSVAASELSWSAVAGAGGYDVVCGDLQYLRDTGDYLGATDLCLGNDHPQTSIGYELTPGSGEAIWFLVREEGGTYDSNGAAQVGSRDSISSSSPACP